MSETKTPSAVELMADPSIPRYFSLVYAEVMFETHNKQIQSRRVQFLSQSAEATFPSARILQLQNSAALQVRNQLGSRADRRYHVHEVLLINIIPLGLMSHTDFYGQGVTAEVNVSNVDAVGSDPAPIDPTNVVPLR